MGDRSHAFESLDELRRRWQQMLECMAHQLAMPVAMINVVQGPELVVLGVSDETQGFRQGQRAALVVNSFCANVLHRGEDLFVGDVRRLPSIAKRNPSADLGFVHYYGEPIRDPEGSVVGTLCVMDKRPRPDAPGIRHLVSITREAIEHDLRMMLHSARLERLNQELKNAVQFLFGALNRAGMNGRDELAAQGFSNSDLVQLGELSSAASGSS